VQALYCTVLSQDLCAQLSIAPTALLTACLAVAVESSLLASLCKSSKLVVPLYHLRRWWLFIYWQVELSGCCGCKWRQLVIFLNWWFHCTILRRRWQFLFGTIFVLLHILFGTSFVLLHILFGTIFVLLHFLDWTDVAFPGLDRLAVRVFWCLVLFDIFSWGPALEALVGTVYLLVWKHAERYGGKHCRRDWSESNP
jgi:hypothetical protein